MRSCHNSRMTIALVRHGETEWNRRGLVQGTSDIPLNDTGRGQAWEAAKVFSRVGWDRIVTSTLSRARETGEILATRLGLAAPSTDAALVERRYGRAEGMPFRAYDHHAAERAPDAGRESREEVTRRMVAAIERLATAHPGESLILVTHGGAIRAALAELAPELDFPAIPNLSAHTLQHGRSGLEFLRFDDTFDDRVTRSVRGKRIARARHRFD